MNQRDWLPNMIKIPAKDGIRLVRKGQDMTAIDVLTLNGVHLTAEDRRWLSAPDFRYFVSHNPQMGTICAIAVPHRRI
jgi:hypothetical protein